MKSGEIEQNSNFNDSEESRASEESRKAIEPEAAEPARPEKAAAAAEDKTVQESGAETAAPAGENLSDSEYPGTAATSQSVPEPEAPSATAKFCPNCGTALGAETQFCPNCGAAQGSIEAGAQGTSINTAELSKAAQGYWSWLKDSLSYPVTSDFHVMTDQIAWINFGILVGLSSLSAALVLRSIGIFFLVAIVGGGMSLLVTLLFATLSNAS